MPWPMRPFEDDAPEAVRGEPVAAPRGVGIIICGEVWIMVREAARESKRVAWREWRTHVLSRRRERATRALRIVWLWRQRKKASDERVGNEGGCAFGAHPRPRRQWMVLGHCDRRQAGVRLIPVVSSQLHQALTMAINRCIICLRICAMHHGFS